MAKDKRSRDQKRKAKLALRARKQTGSHSIEPYTGRKYQQPHWTPLVFATELPIYEVIQTSDRRLTNETVQAALSQLVLGLRGGLPPTLSPDELQPDVVIGAEAPFLIWNIRRHWTTFFQREHTVAVPDLVGVLRTLLNSIQAHQWNTGRDHGYVAFLDKFMERGGVDVTVKTAAEVDWEPQQLTQRNE
jgi:hypothetical protein